MESLTLYELNNRIKNALKSSLPDRYWVTAEITEVQLNSSGHCYLQLADKKAEDESIVATARATVWAFTFRTLRPYFETTTGQSLAKGMKVLVNVEVVFHEVYGYSLNVRDIDPTYTVGDLERKKRQILQQLQEEGIIDMNRELEFPLLPKNIAVISSPTAAGWGDFIHQLDHNPYGFRFHVKLFPAVMQGEKTAESVIAALDRIYAYEFLFDVVVIIRGGGSQSDLGCFDTYDIAANIAQFPIPVISGIGHERDETIVDRVAHLRVKTPTAAAAFLIAVFQERESELAKLKNDFVSAVQLLLNQEKNVQLRWASEFRQGVLRLLSGNAHRLQLLSQKTKHATTAGVRRRRETFAQLKIRLQGRLAMSVERQDNQLVRAQQRLKQQTQKILNDQRQRLELADVTIKYVDPKHVLKRGYSITRFQGKAVLKPATLKEGDVLETEVAGGMLYSVYREKHD